MLMMYAIGCFTANYALIKSYCSLTSRFGAVCFNFNAKRVQTDDGNKIAKVMGKET